MSQKSILEQALLQVQTLEEAVKQNAKGILASTMKQELNDLLKEAEDEGETPEVAEQDVPSDEPGDNEPADDESDEISDEPVSDEEDSEDDEEIPADDEELPADDEELPVDDEEMPADDEDDVVDMTSASDDEVLKVFRAMKPEDGIVVKKEGDKISLNVDDEEYIIKLGDDEGMGLNENTDESMVDTSMLEYDESDDKEGTVFEIALDEEESDSEKEDDEDDEEEEEGETKKGEHTEASATLGNDVRGAARQGKKYKAGRRPDPQGKLDEEVSGLRKQFKFLKRRTKSTKRL